jgi:hypothetical protein
MRSVKGERWQDRQQRFVVVIRFFDSHKNYVTYTKLENHIKEHDVNLFPRTCCSNVCSIKCSININHFQYYILAIAARYYFINRQFMVEG